MREDNGFRLAEKFYLEAKFNTKAERMGVPSERSFWFMDAKSYENKLHGIKDKQIPDFLSGNIEEIV